ncbi:hypothetical protein KQI42_09745 [Tissierella sp. MSJ-40]|uniref:Uncharacterized protein n=1 Tax=Tissierella simiarum TaxID=2841534 RepID=A0ABS6E5T8_9FIRM|nr:hypothetical protein [Tissierella simiarum]MBU5438292.1 hypothetical protein [Tissierella simiarum]
MAVKKNTNSPEETVNVIETKKAKTENEGYKHFVYIGPSLPGGKLKSNIVLCGGIEEIKTYYKEVLEEYPEIVRLIVPVHKLGEMKAKVQAPGNVINKYYNDIASAMSNNKEE